MPKKKTLSLKEARNKGKLNEFVKEHSKDSKGDKERFEKTLDSMTRTPRPQQKSK